MLSLQVFWHIIYIYMYHQCGNLLEYQLQLKTFNYPIIFSTSSLLMLKDAVSEKTYSVKMSVHLECTLSFNSIFDQSAKHLMSNLELSRFIPLYLFFLLVICCHKTPQKYIFKLVYTHIFLCVGPRSVNIHRAVQQCKRNIPVTVFIQFLFCATYPVCNIYYFLLK